MIAYKRSYNTSKVSQENRRYRWGMAISKSFIFGMILSFWIPICFARTTQECMAPYSDLQNKVNELNTKITSLKSRSQFDQFKLANQKDKSDITFDQWQSTQSVSPELISLQSELTNAKADLSLHTRECNKTVANDNCTAKGDGYEWKDGECKQREKTADRKKSNTPADSGECSRASEFEGTLKGEACREALNTVNNTKSRSNAINESTSILANATAQTAAMKAQPSATSTLDASSKALNGMAIAKLAQGTSDASAYNELKNAGSNAEEAVQLMQAAKSEIETFCNDSQNTNGYLTGPNGYNSCITKQLTARQLPDPNIDTMDKLDRAIAQTRTQAESAKNASGASGIQSIANMFVAAQAMNAAKNMKNSAQSLGPGMLPVVQIGSVGAFPTGASITADTTTPVQTDLYDPNTGSFAFPSGGHGGIRGGLKGGGLPGMGGAAPVGVAKASVSGASSGGLGGGGGYKPPSKAAKSGKKGPAAVGDYAAGTGIRNAGGSAPGAGGDTSLTDALSKLFGGDPNNMQQGVMRGPASEGGHGNQGEYAEEGSLAYEQEATLFQIVSTKIRQLNNRGQI